MIIKNIILNKSMIVSVWIQIKTLVSNVSDQFINQIIILVTNL